MDRIILIINHKLYNTPDTNRNNVVAVLTDSIMDKNKVE